MRRSISQAMSNRPGSAKTSPVQQNGTTPDVVILRPHLHPAKAGGPDLLAHTRPTLIHSLHTSIADASFRLAFRLRSAGRLSLLLCICWCISPLFPSTIPHWSQLPSCLLSISIDAPSFGIALLGSHAAQIMHRSVRLTLPPLLRLW